MWVLGEARSRATSLCQVPSEPLSREMRGPETKPSCKHLPPTTTCKQAAIILFDLQSILRASELVTTKIKQFKTSIFPASLESQKSGQTAKVW